MSIRALLVTIWLTTLASVALAAPTTAPSYWGPLPAPGDSATAAARNNPTPLWEATLLVPYRIVALPFRGVSYGVGASVAFLDRHHVISRIERLVGPRRGPFGVLLNFTAGGLPGLGGGVTVLHDAFLSPENRFKLRFQSSVKGSNRVTLGIRLREGHDDRFEIGAGYRLQPNARFFGIGPRAPEENESFYTQELTWGGVTYTRKVAGPLSAEASAVISAIGARGSDDDSPSLETRFAGETPAGFHDRSDGVAMGLALRYDTASAEGRPTYGGIRRVRAAYFESTDDTDVAFWTYRGEFEEYIPLWHSYRALAVRGYMSWIDPVGDDEMPFQRLMTNDDPDLLRGYRDFRWRDRGMTALSVEYRWPMWASRTAEGFGLDMYVLADFGQVFGDTDEIGFRRLTDSYGVGIRIATLENFLGRVEVAWSNEETAFRLRADQIFQFARSGLYHGRDPVPTR